MQRVEQHASFGGSQEVWQFTSAALGGETKFAVYLPPAALRGQACPVLYWLSGLTCTEQNFITKSGFQQHAAEHGLYDIRGLGAKRKLPTFDDLTFLTASASRYPLEGYREKCSTKTLLGTRFAKKPVELEIPITIAGMSFGALSANVKEALGRAATEMGTSTTTGDGGMTQEERGSSKTLVYQCLPSRYGFNPDDTEGRQVNRRQLLRFMGAYKLGLVSKEPNALMDDTLMQGVLFRDADQDLINDLSTEDLYVAAIAAYDYAAATRKEKVLLWTTKISCPSRGLGMPEKIGRAHV